MACPGDDAFMMIEFFYDKVTENAARVQWPQSSTPSFMQRTRAATWHPRPQLVLVGVRGSGTRRHVGTAGCGRDEPADDHDNTAIDGGDTQTTTTNR